MQAASTECLDHHMTAPGIFPGGFCCFNLPGRGGLKYSAGNWNPAQAVSTHGWADVNADGKTLHLSIG